MLSSKNVLMVLGAVTAIMGALALSPVDLGATEPVWHSVAKIVVGLAALYVGYADKEKK